ncbi:MAG: ribonuclease domain-containing protein [Janthinobacterium lividum]
MAAHASITSSVSRFFLAACLLASLTTGTTDASARDSIGMAARQLSQDSIPLTDLPLQGRRTYQAILEGGPFRHDKDGTAFGNRERLLPLERRGHYREYTVDTPGASNRGAQRIVCGGRKDNDEKRSPPVAACWYTADHYASFRRIVP